MYHKWASIWITCVCVYESISAPPPITTLLFSTSTKYKVIFLRQNRNPFPHWKKKPLLQWKLLFPKAVEIHRSKKWSSVVKAVERNMHIIYTFLSINTCTYDVHAVIQIMRKTITWTELIKRSFIFGKKKNNNNKYENNLPML